MQIEMNIQTITVAFNTIHNPKSSPIQIKNANAYFSQCERNCEFVLLLLKMFEIHTNQEIQLQALLLATNVIKRNWRKNRNTFGGGDLISIKQQIKTIVLKLYLQKYPKYIKHLNELIKYLTRQQYPKQYMELHNLILSKLAQIGSQVTNFTNIYQFQARNFLPFLATVKKVMKQFSIKRLTQDSQSFLNYIVPVIKLIAPIQNWLVAVLKNYFGSNQIFKIDSKVVSHILQSIRKCEKITLYGLHFLPLEMQKNLETAEMVYKYVQKIKDYNEALQHFKDRQDPGAMQIQKNMMGLLDILSKLQTLFPFLFTQFLDAYIKVIFAVLIRPDLYTYSKVNTQVIKCLTRIFQNYSYYMSPNQYKNSTMHKKSSFDYSAEQQICHQKFMSIFTSDNISQFFKKILNQLLVYHFRNKSSSDDEEGNFEDNDGDSLLSLTNNEISPGDLLLVLLRNMMRCFKQTCMKILNDILQHIISDIQIFKKNKNIFDNILQLIIIAPNIYDTQQLPLKKIMSLLQVFYKHHQYIYFAKVIQAYHDHLDAQALRQLFVILCKLVCFATSDVPPKALYYCLLCVKKMVNKHQQEQIPFDNIQGCLEKIFDLVKFYQTDPVHLWPLISLANQFIKALPDSVVNSIADNLVFRLSKLFQIQKSQQLLVMGLCDMVINLLSVANKMNEDSYLRCMMLVKINLPNKNFQNITCLLKIWLQVARKYNKENANSEQNQFMTTLLKNWSNQIEKEDKQIYIEILEQYMLGGLLEISDKDLIFFIKKYELTNQQINNRTSVVCFSFYFSYTLKNSTCIPQFVICIIENIKKMHLLISPHANSLRTLLFTIINHHIICFGSEKILQIIRSVYQKWENWFIEYCWGLDYLQTKYSYKIVALGMLHSLQYLESNNMLLTKVKDIQPISYIIKNMVVQLQPMKHNKATISFINLYTLAARTDLIFRRQRNNQISRKINFQVSQEICKQDLRQIFKMKIGDLFRRWNWSQEEIKNKFGEHTLAKIKEAFSDQPYQLQEIDSI